MGMSDRQIVGEYDEIVVGEQNRGGQHMMGLSPEAAYEVLGELVQKSPALNALVQKRIADNRPIVRKVAPTKWRDWQVDFPSTFASAGTTTTLIVNPQVIFQGQRIMATDTYSLGAGYGTRIGSILVGMDSQRPANQNSTLTAFFANNSIGTGVMWDTCQIGNQISVTVQFVQTCTFDMSVFGRAVK